MRSRAPRGRVLALALALMLALSGQLVCVTAAAAEEEPQETAGDAGILYVPESVNASLKMNGDGTADVTLDPGLMQPAPEQASSDTDEEAAGEDNALSGSEEAAGQKEASSAALETTEPNTDIGSGSTDQDEVLMDTKAMPAAPTTGTVFINASVVKNKTNTMYEADKDKSAANTTVRFGLFDEAGNQLQTVSTPFDFYGVNGLTAYHQTWYLYKDSDTGETEIRDNNSQGFGSLVFRNLEFGKTYYIYQLDSSGNKVATGTLYDDKFLPLDEWPVAFTPSAETPKTWLSVNSIRPGTMRFTKYLMTKKQYMPYTLTEDTAFTFGLFDESGNLAASKSFTLPKDSTSNSMSLVWENIMPGTYTLYELDADGNKIEENGTFTAGSGAEYTVSGPPNSSGQYPVKNITVASSATVYANPPVFNYYSAKGTLPVSGIKTVETIEPTWKMKEGLFSFGIGGGGASGDWSRTVKNSADGSFDLGEITFDERDIGKTYTITIYEGERHSGDYPLVFPDGAYSLTVKINDKGDGTLAPEIAALTCKDENGETVDVSDRYVTVSDSGGKITGLEFINEYKTYGGVTFSGIKELEGETLSEGQFSFTITEVDENGEPVEDGYSKTVQNEADGTITLLPDGGLQYGSSGTYYYEITEVADEEQPYAFDDGVVLVTVEVTESESHDSSLSSSVSFAKDGEAVEEIRFINRPGGSLKILKTVVVDGAEAAEPPQTLTFTVEGPEGFETTEISFDEFEEGTYTLKNIPVGTYTIKETDGGGEYSFSSDLSSDGMTVDVVRGETAEAKITNTYVKKEAEEGGSDDEKKDSEKKDMERITGAAAKPGKKTVPVIRAEKAAAGVKTGDGSNVVFFMLLLLAASVLTGIVWAARRRGSDY